MVSSEKLNYLPRFIYLLNTKESSLQMKYATGTKCPRRGKTPKGEFMRKINDDLFFEVHKLVHIAFTAKRSTCNIHHENQ